MNIQILFSNTFKNELGTMFEYINLQCIHLQACKEERSGSEVEC